MHLAGLADTVLADPALATALADAAAGSSSTGELTGPEALRPFLVAGLAKPGRSVLVVTATTREAEQLVAEIGDFLGSEGVAYYPSWETLPHERLSPRSDTVGRRLAVLRRLCHPGDSGANGPVRVVVAPVRSMLQPQVKGLGDLTPVELTVGATADLDDVVAGLAGAAYSRVDLVEKRGEFAVRGGIVDVFPPTEEHPLRVEFFGDEVEEIRSFAVADQRTIERLVAAVSVGIVAGDCAPSRHAAQRRDDEVDRRVARAERPRHRGRDGDPEGDERRGVVDQRLALHDRGEGDQLQLAHPENLQIYPYHLKYCYLKERD